MPSGCGAFMFAKKLKLLKSSLCSCAKASFGALNSWKTFLVLDLGSLDILKQVC